MPKTFCLAQMRKRTLQNPKTRLKNTSRDGDDEDDENRPLHGPCLCLCVGECLCLWSVVIFLIGICVPERYVNYK